MTPPSRRWARFPRSVWLVALGAALFHMFPYWRTQIATPPGWTFTSNTTISPDQMQYRVWMRQTQVQGPVVDNRFTTEPHRPYLLLPFYWTVGAVARGLSASPESVYWWVGAPLAVALTLLLFSLCRRFLSDSYQQWVVFLAILFGGGIGGHLKILAETPVGKLRFFELFVSEPLRSWTLFEDHRQHYVVKTLFDTHFLVIWLAALGAVGCMLVAVRSPSVRSWVAVSILTALVTILHLYEGVTITVIASGIAFVCALKGCIPVRRGMTLVGVTLAGAMPVLLWWFLSYSASGLPWPAWREPLVLPSLLFLAFPLAWIALLWGGRTMWAEAELDDCLLVGWALGCTVLTQLGPFYPYVGRGIMTMQVPLTLLAGRIVFRRYARLPRRLGLAVLLTLSATPVWLIARTVYRGGFEADAPWKHINQGQVAVLDGLERNAQPEDVLLIEARDALWLAPHYPGKLYVGHFFLTVDFARKTADLERFLSASTSDQERMLRDWGVRWLYVRRELTPHRFLTVTHLAPVIQTSAGTLFRFDGSS